MISIIKLPLTQEEKSKLRKARVKISELHIFTVDHISELLDIPLEKAKTLKGLAEFQTIPSIGYKLAEKLVFQLKLYSLTEIKNKNAAFLFDQLEQQLGVWTDSCVEDQIRCVIHYANNQNSNKQWFDFTEERKVYREKYGFPETRPTKAWFEDS
ncbi:helix-hairpin-helix domain-containing protein [Alkalihalobacterium bogoriense]|uniref:helix-hairpin-helix domain-containing protein n=1 Tax=Alkalihalobacterium bogoriense TaxID=246272 RepID=UPI0004788D8D|nr:helix-hairpin-helix domain-containing protein [Alkalihalobacterium bogoriense]